MNNKKLLDKAEALLLDKVVGEIRHRYDNGHEEQGALIMMCHFQNKLRPIFDKLRANLAI